MRPKLLYDIFFEISNNQTKFGTDKEEIIVCFKFD